jgi:ABC-type multidrug transport system fused ATPase/permease subunit
MAALMRLVEIDEGTIMIDNINTRLLGLQRLRSNIAVIPQDPVLFSGTIKSNLDPFDEFSEERLKQVLLNVGLMSETNRKAVINSSSDEVLEGGKNYSVGQRQLIAIGRALLRNASIIICDEATAAVDAETDGRIQKIFRSEFSNATCLTIAHRINTVLDSDFVLVMDDGRAAEFDTPDKLLQSNGIFRGLVEAWEEET